MSQVKQELLHFMQDKMLANQDGVITSSAVFCCVPRGCDRYREDLISLDNPGDAVKVLCNFDGCSESGWMHGDCFQEWEQQVLSCLRSCSRARSWNDKQRLQNLWNKRGYDLVYKACDCKCGRGHLRKDLDYVPETDDRRQGKKLKLKIQRPPLKPMSIPNQRLFNSSMNFSSHTNMPYAHMDVSNQPQLRIRTNSLSSTGSSCSPPSSAGTPPETPNSLMMRKKFDFFQDTQQAAAGNIFRRRTDYSVFGQLPRHQQNPYHIKMEDEGPHGNDETRCFVLTNLSTNQVTCVGCVICNTQLPVFDKYPLIDGTFFLSPQRYHTDLQVTNEHRRMYLNAVCMKCLQGRQQQRPCCIACKKPWFGSAFVIGSMYAYDIFAAIPCCPQRLACKNCNQAILDPSCSFSFFSEYSKQIRCPHCQVEDYHFIKPLEQLYTLRRI